jgi:glycosyltransferase involved in cell wall biosynthesis
MTGQMTGTPQAMTAERMTAAHIQGEVAEIRAIYDLLYPDQNLTYLFRAGKDAIWGAPEVTHGPHTFRPGEVSANYRGMLRRPGLHPAAAEVTVDVAIPRRPLPHETTEAEAPWRGIRPLRPLQRVSPLAYEQIRYLAEMIRKKRAHRHSTQALPLGEGAASFPRPAEPASDKRPAVLIGMHWLEHGGAEKLAFDCVNWALESGLRVFVVAGVASVQRLAGRLPDHPDLRLIRLDRYLPYELWPRYVEQLVRSENIRLVHIHHCRQLYDSLPHLRISTPWVRVIDSTHIVEYADGGYPRISGVWSEFIDLHHVISGELVDYFRDTFHLLGKVRLGRMLDRAAEPRSLPPVRMQPGQKQLHVAFVGRLFYQKRPIVAAETVAALANWARNNGVAFRASMVGEGPFLGAMRHLLQRRGLAEQVALLPANTDVPALLRQADVMILPSNNEGLALVCYEAIEQGCIPISTDVGSQDEVVPADLLVPLAPRKTVQATVAAVDDLWRDPAFNERQQAEMRRLWTRLGEDPTARELLSQVYRRVAAGGAGFEGDGFDKDIQA